MPTKQQIIDAILADAAAFGIDPEIAVRQCRTESSFSVSAYNKRSDCFGLFQLSRAAALEMNVDRLDWRENISGGLRYLSKMLRRFDEDYPKALAAYNYGPTKVRRLLNKWGANWREHLPAETKNYLTKILRRPLVKRGGVK